MRKRRFHILLQFATLLLPFLAASQTVPDSLEGLLQGPMHDTVRLQRYFDLVTANLKPNIAKSLQYADSATLLSQQLKDERLTQLSGYHHGVAYRFAGKYSKAMEHLGAYRAFCEAKKDKAGLANALFQMAFIQDMQGDKEMSLSTYQKALSINRELGNRKAEAEALSSMGEVFQGMNQHEKAAALRLEAVNILEALKDTVALGNAYNNLGNTYRHLKDFDKAELYYQKDYELAKRTGDEFAMGYALHHLGRIFRLKKQYERAEQLLLESLAIRRKLGHKTEIVYSLNGLAQMYNDQKRHREALGLAKEALELCRSENIRSQEVNVLSLLSEANYGLGEYKESMDLYLRRTELRDSLMDVETTNQMAEMDARYQASEKDKALKISELENQGRKLQIAWLVALTIALAALAGVIFFGLKNRMRANHRIAEQQDTLRQQEIRQLEQANQLTALSAMLEGQEQERSRIAADLHDSLGGLLASIKSHFNAAPPPNADNDIFEKTNAMLDGASTEVRRISHNMMPRALSLSGLKGAIEDLAQDLERQGLSCQLELIGLDDLPLEPARSVMVYRIVQELTHNAVKHAQASHLLLQAIRHEGRLTLLVEDDGKGFEVGAARLKKGLGLSSVESRVQFLNGEIEWDSVQGQGTTVSVTMPING